MAVTLMLLSHSPKIAEGIKDLAGEVAGEAPIIAIGGTNDGRLGSDFDRIYAAMSEAAEKGDVVVLSDMGSSALTAETARDALDEPLQQKVFLCSAALVEGGVAAAVSAKNSETAAEVLEDLKEYLLDK
jgi:PTS hybrid protein